MEQFPLDEVLWYTQVLQIIFFSVVSPLTDLLKAYAKYVCSPTCQQAFQTIKFLLCCTLMLATSHLQEPLKLQVGGCQSSGADVVLFQA